MKNFLRLIFVIVPKKAGNIILQILIWLQFSKSSARWLLGIISIALIIAIVFSVMNIFAFPSLFMSFIFGIIIKTLFATSTIIAFFQTFKKSPHHDKSRQQTRPEDSNPTSERYFS